MIHEEICTSEVAKLAKDKGFPLQKVIKQDRRAFFYELPQSHPDWANCDAWYLPTQSLLQRWLREEKNIHIEIIATASGYYWCVNKTNVTSITDSDVLNRGTNEGGCFDTYELALEDALKYALENLV
jgi:hypothetical protein